MDAPIKVVDFSKNPQNIKYGETNLNYYDYLRDIEIPSEYRQIIFEMEYYHSQRDVFCNIDGQIIKILPEEMFSNNIYAMTYTNKGEILFDNIKYDNDYNTYVAIYNTLTGVCKRMRYTSNDFVGVIVGDIFCAYCPEEKSIQNEEKPDITPIPIKEYPSDKIKERLKDNGIIPTKDYAKAEAMIKTYCDLYATDRNNSNIDIYSQEFRVNVVQKIWQNIIDWYSDKSCYSYRHSPNSDHVLILLPNMGIAHIYKEPTSGECFTPTFNLPQFGLYNTEKNTRGIQGNVSLDRFAEQIIRESSIGKNGMLSPVYIYYYKLCINDKEYFFKYHKTLEIAESSVNGNKMLISLKKADIDRDSESRILILFSETSLPGIIDPTYYDSLSYINVKEELSRFDITKRNEPIKIKQKKSSAEIFDILLTSIYKIFD